MLDSDLTEEAKHYVQNGTLLDGSLPGEDVARLLNKVFDLAEAYMVLEYQLAATNKLPKKASNLAKKIKSFLSIVRKS